MICSASRPLLLSHSHIKNMKNLKTGILKQLEETQDFQVAHSTQLSELIQIDNSHHSSTNLNTKSGWLHVFEDRKLNIANKSEKEQMMDGAQNFISGLEALGSKITPKIWKRYFCYIKPRNTSIGKVNILYKSWIETPSEPVNVEPICLLSNIVKIENLHGQRSNKIRAWSFYLYFKNGNDPLLLQAENEDDLFNWIKLIQENMKIESHHASTGDAGTISDNPFVSDPETSHPAPAMQNHTEVNVIVNRRNSEASDASSSNLSHMTKSMKDTFNSENLLTSFSNFSKKVDEEFVNTGKNLSSAIDKFKKSAAIPENFSIPDKLDFKNKFDKLGLRSSTSNLNNNPNLIVLGEKFQTLSLVKNIANVQVSAEDLATAPKSFEFICDYYIDELFNTSGSPFDFGSIQKLKSVVVGNELLKVDTFMNWGLGKFFQR